MSDNNIEELHFPNDNAIHPSDLPEGKKKRTKTIIIKKFSYKKCLKVSAAIFCTIVVVFIGLLIFVMTGDSNAGLPPTSSSYTITVQQSIREKLTNAETG